MKAGFSLLYYSGIARLFAQHSRGMGAIFMLHHIRPSKPSGSFQPNSVLEITPEFLEEAIRYIRNQGYEIVSLGEAHQRLISKICSKKPFAVITIDDGYKDNLEHAFPVFERSNCPFTVFVATAIIDGASELWWKGLEEVLLENTTVSYDIGNGPETAHCTSVEEKQAVFETLHRFVRAMNEHGQRRWIREFCSQHTVDIDALCRREAMTWDEVRQLDTSPLCTIGAHSVNHFSLKKLDEDEVINEIQKGRIKLENELGKLPMMFAYPFGDKSSADDREFSLVEQEGFSMAVTTRSGIVQPKHVQSITAVPRVSLNGGFQKTRYLNVLMSGTSFSLVCFAKQLLLRTRIVK